MWKKKFFPLKSQEEVLANQTVTVSLLFAEQQYDRVCYPLAVRYSTLHHTAGDSQGSLHYLLKLLIFAVVIIIFLPLLLLLL